MSEWKVIKVGSKFLGPNGNLVWNEKDAINFRRVDEARAQKEADRLSQRLGQHTELVDAS